jgi:hypothetical protein
MVKEPSQSGVELGHLQRQIALCERLIATLHQPELLGTLSQLRGEYERQAAALRVNDESAATTATTHPPAAA